MSFPRYPKYKDSGVEWLGEVPEHWDVVPFFSVAMEREEQNLGMKEDNLLSLSYGRIVPRDINTNDGLLPESFETYQIIQPGDIVFRLTDLQNDKRSLRTAIVQETGIITSAYVAAKPLKVDPDYLNNLLRAYDVTKVFYSMGGGLRQSMKYGDLKWLPTLMPPSQEQLTIAAFLDRETEKIDALVAEQEKLISLLKEKRQAVISHVVTKGLNPNAKMKDSGIEWLNEVPEQWEIKRIKFLLRNNGLVRGPFGGDLKKEIFVSDGVKVYEQKNAIYRDHLLGDSFISESKFNALTRFQVYPGDYLMSCSGTIGKVYRIPEGAAVGIINQALLIIRFKEVISTNFADWVLSANFFQLQILDNSQGGAMKNLVGMNVFSSIVLPIPPLIEQDAIAYFLNNETSRIDSLINEAEHAIELLKERRNGLISAAVTGKIDVRNAGIPAEAGILTEEVAV